MKGAVVSAKVRIATRATISIILAGLLSACVSVTPVKDVTADKLGYLNQKFSPGVLAPIVSKSLPTEGKATNFGQLKITMEATSEQNDGKKDSWKRVLTFIDSGNGLVQRMAEVSNNDISYLITYSLTYKGIFDLKWQEVPLRGVNAAMPYEVKQIVKFDPIPASAGKEFSIDLRTGSEPQIANYFAHQRLCKTIRSVSASDIYSKIPGQALELECQLQRNNVVESRSKWALLQTYGLAIPLEDITSSKKTTFRVVGIDG